MRSGGIRITTVPPVVPCIKVASNPAIDQDEHYWTVCRYVERNPLRAKLVDRAEEWRWCNWWRRVLGSCVLSLAAWAVPARRAWVSHVSRVNTEAELQAVHCPVVRGTPFGEAAWLQRMARRRCLDSTLGSRGWPKKEATQNP